jgi:prevent-host-death family protein
MKSIPAGQFKNRCLKMLDDVATSREPVVITKRGRPVAKLGPIAPPQPRKSLKGSVLAEQGDPFGTGESWSDDAA